MARERTHYDLLDVSRSADTAEIRRQWKVLMQVWHPDRFSGKMRDEAEAMTARLTDAWTTLRDEAQRSAYDAAHPPKAAAAAATGDSPRRRTARRAPGPAPTASAAHAGFTAHPHVAAAATAPRPTFEERLVGSAADIGNSIRRNPHIAAAVVALWALIALIMAASWLTAGPSGKSPLDDPAVASLQSAAALDADVFADLEDPLAGSGTPDTAAIEQLRRLTEAETERQRLANEALRERQRAMEAERSAAQPGAGRKVTIQPEPEVAGTQPAPSGRLLRVEPTPQ